MLYFSTEPMASKLASQGLRNDGWGSFDHSGSNIGVGDFILSWSEDFVPPCADLVAGADFVCLCAPPWQAQHVGNAHVQISWQVQHFVNLQCADFLAGTALCAGPCADFFAGAGPSMWRFPGRHSALGTPMCISWHAQHFADHPVQILWQAQHFVHLHVWSQAQLFVNLHVDFVAGTVLWEPPCADFVAGTASGELLGENWWLCMDFFDQPKRTNPEAGWWELAIVLYNWSARKLRTGDFAVQLQHAEHLASWKMRTGDS